MSVVILGKTPEGGENGLLSTRVALQLLALTGLLFVMNALDINTVVREVYRNVLMYLGSAMILANKKETRAYVWQLFKRAKQNMHCLTCATSHCGARRIGPLTPAHTTACVDNQV